MSVTPTLNLYVDSTNYDPPYYWMDVVIAPSSGHQPSGLGVVPTATSNLNQFHVDVNVDSASGGNDTIEVDFGQIAVDVQNDEIHTNLKDGGGNGVGGGIIKFEDAQEGTRPIHL